MLSHHPCLILLLPTWPLLWICFWTPDKYFWPSYFHLLDSKRLFNLIHCFLPSYDCTVWSLCLTCFFQSLADGDRRSRDHIIMFGTMSGHVGGQGVQLLDVKTTQRFAIRNWHAFKRLSSFIGPPKKSCPTCSPTLSSACFNFSLSARQWGSQLAFSLQLFGDSSRQ